MWTIRIFKTFLWKNWKCINVISAILQLILLIAILGVYLNQTDNLKILPETQYEEKNEQLLSSLFSGEEDDFIFYAPSNLFIDDLMEKVRLDLCVLADRLVPFATAEEMFLELEGKTGTRSFGIFFQEFPSSVNKSSSKHLKYGISSPAISISTEHKYLNDYETVGIKEYDDYIGSGLFLLQRNIDKIFMNEVTGKNSIYETEILPVPSISVEVADSGRIKSFGLLFIVLLNILLLSMVLVPLVEEKQDGIKEFLVLATPYNYLNGITFAFIRFWIFLFFGGTSLAAAYMWNAIGEISLIYTSSLFILTIFSQLCFTFLISVIFNSVFFAKVGGLLLLLVPAGIFALEINSCWYFSMFFSSNTFLEGMSIFQKFTNKHHLFDTSSLDHYITPTSFQLLSVYTTLIMQAALYCFFYWYLSHVLPGKGGIAKPLDFFLQSSYYKASTPSFTEPSEQSLQPEVAVKIRKLTKDVNISMFDKVKCGLGKSKRIVDNLSMDIENNKITVLLGHNGAGKTTTINMIVGCINKTFGDIIVSNEKDVSVYRHLIGYCPQHNIFLPYLTCAEHFHFFAALRGLDNDEAESRSNYILKQLKLSDKANEKGRNLSGGMKRRLSLGIAISGNTKVVILDEPSSGLDPESRRDLWNSLLELRKTQAVLVTTHHMDEAEILGDSVAILSNGKLKLYGETLELKRNYGSGYILKLLTEENFQQEEIMKIIKEIIPTATIKTFVQPTLCVTLPYKYQSQYQFVLNRLESCQNLGISSISISDTSLEEVFLNSESVDQCDTIKYREIKSQDVNTTTNPARDPKILANQTFAIFYKKAVFVRRQWIYTALMCSLPIIMSVLALWAVGFQRINSEMTALPLNLNYIRDAKIYANIPPEFSNFKDYLKSEIQGKAQIIFLHGDKSIDQEMLSLQQKDLHNFHHTVIGALEMKITSDDSPSIIKIYYSSNILHSSVIMLNLVDNIILKDMSSDKKASIEASQIPTKRVADISPTRLEYYNVLVPIGWIVYMLYYISLPFMEQKNEFKNLQPVPKLAYWLSFTFFDAVLHTIICICALLLQTLLPIREVFNTSELIWLTATYMFYGISYLPILYIMANTFKSLSGLIALYIFIVVVSCIAPLITSTNHQAMDKFSEIIMLMSVIPDFSLNHQMRIIGENYFINRRNDLVAEEFGLHVPLGVNFTGKQVKPLDNTIFFFYAILVLIVSEIFLIFVWEDINFRRAIESVFSFGCFRRAKTKPSFELDEDVSLEQDIVAEEIKNIGKDNKHKKDDSSPLLVNCVHKKYKNIHAVRGLTFRVKKGECFGLLGINGAGKTSTFQMITGNEKITKGDVYIEHINVHQYKNWYKFLFGYCPQVDALNGFMSSYEILKYMALLRAIPHKDVDNEVKYWLRQLNLERYKDDPIVHYSGGTKRKLNVALAMIGNPKVLFLDEPTTGVDPVSRRFMWECIQKFQKSEKTIVLTSHSMDECEYLCNRLAIMTDGQFQCVGYIPMLKAKFGSGFTIKFRIKDNCSEGDCHQFNNYVLSKFKCSLIEKHASVLTYFVTDKNVIWSKVFIVLEEIKLNCHVLCEYSINETTLEDIFLKFRGKLEEVLIC